MAGGATHRIYRFYLILCGHGEKDLSPQLHFYRGIAISELPDLTERERARTNATSEPQDSQESARARTNAMSELPHPPECERARTNATGTPGISRMRAGSRERYLGTCRFPKKYERANGVARTSPQTPKSSRMRAGTNATSEPRNPIECERARTNWF